MGQQKHEDFSRMWSRQSQRFSHTSRHSSKPRFTAVTSVKITLQLKYRSVPCGYETRSIWYIKETPYLKSYSKFCNCRVVFVISKWNVETKIHFG